MEVAAYNDKTRDYGNSISGGDLVVWGCGEYVLLITLIVAIGFFALIAGESLRKSEETHRGTGDVRFLYGGMRAVLPVLREGRWWETPTTAVKGDGKEPQQCLGGGNMCYGMVPKRGDSPGTGDG